MLPKSFVVHKEIAEMAITIDAIKPASERLSAERPFGPTTVGKTKRHIVAQTVILQQHLQWRVPTRRQSPRRSINIIGTSAITQQAINPFTTDPTETSVRLQPLCEAVVIGQLGVAKDRRGDPKCGLHQSKVPINLGLELVLVVEERQRMVTRLSQKVTRSSLGQLSPKINQIGGPTRKLLQSGPGDRERDPETAFVSADQIQQQSGCRAVALVSNLMQNGLIRIIVEVERVVGEDRVIPQAERLVHLKIEADGNHTFNATRRTTIGGRDRMIPFTMTTLPTFEDLARLIADASLLRGEFTLRSGRTSHYYLDKYRFSTKPEILQPLAEMFRERIPEGTQRLAGAELGGIPLVAAASLATGLPSLFVRGERKTHGTGQRIEGELKAGESVLFLEDVATTGGQALEAVEVLQKAGAKVSGVISVINREEGARENIEAAGLKFDSLFSVADLGVVDP